MESSVSRSVSTDRPSTGGALELLTRSRSRPRRGEELRQRQDVAAGPPTGITQRVQADERLVRNLERQFMEREAARAKAAARERAAWTLPAPSHKRNRDGPQQADAEAGIPAEILDARPLSELSHAQRRRDALDVSPRD